MPPVIWEPKKVLVEGLPGSEQKVSVDFEASRSLSDLVVRVVPELEDFVTAVPETFDHVEADTPYTIDLTVSIPEDAEVGSHEGTLHLKQDKRTIPRPLPIEVAVEESATLTMADPVGEGTVEPAVGTHVFPRGSDVAVTGDADDGWQFDHWLVDGEAGPETPEITVTMERDHRVQAVFEEAGELPTIEAPPVDDTVPTTIDQSTRFLYTGDDPVQVGVDPDDIEPRRAAVVRGSVTDRDGAPLPGVEVSVRDHPEYGHTLTRDDGQFDLAVNGGGTVTIEYQRDGYLPAQRQVAVPWQDFAHAPDVSLVTVEERSTTVDLTAETPQVHQASTVSDDDGERTATVLVPESTTAATMQLPDGSTETLESVSIRATEYTVGESGPESMPAELPPNVAYTYAVELSADEALDAGATRLEFDESVVSYVDGFVGFEAGEAVPFAFYDRDAGEWVPSTNGVVASVVGVTDGRADLDVSGDGAADDAETLADHGITDAERGKLADLYETGDTFWRVTVDHFSPWDCNWPFGAPDDARPPNQDDPRKGGPDDPCEKQGSTIETQNQALRHDVDVAGSDQSLHYTTRRTKRRGRTLEIPLTGDSPPDSLKRIELEIRVAGQRHTESFEPGPNKVHEFTWDGRDAYGRDLQGSQPYTVELRYVYPGVYGNAAETAQSFGQSPSTVTGNATREEITFTQSLEGVIGPLYDVGLGGWTLTDHHRYDPTGRTMYLGDGTQRSAELKSPIISTVAGSGLGGRGGFSGDGGPATEAEMSSPRGMAVAPDGSFYVADSGNDRVRRVGPDGIITTVAGTGESGFSGDGGPATEARLNFPMGVDVGPKGSLYIADRGNNRVRRVDPDGTITTVAGNGDIGLSGDGGPATEAEVTVSGDVALGPDGSLYVGDGTGRVRRVGPDGIITTFAGRGGVYIGDDVGDGGPATEAKIGPPAGLTVAPDGSLYIVEWQRVRRVGPDGIITTVAGTSDFGFSGDGGPATEATLQGPKAVAVDSQGNRYIADWGNNRVRRVGPDGTITTVVGTGESGFEGDGGPALRAELGLPGGVALGPEDNLYVVGSRSNRVRKVSPQFGGFSIHERVVSSRDGSELYVFDARDRHRKTQHAVTGETLREFTYDDTALVGVTDSDGNTLTVGRDADGNPTTITSPFGQETDLSLDDSGYLSAITNPAGQQWQFSYTDDGMLVSRTDPRGNTSEYSHDEDGLLVEARDPDGAVQTLERTETEDGFEVVHTSREDLETRFTWEQPPEGGHRAVTVKPNGARTEAVIRGGVREVSYADGASLTLRQTGDPRFGMQTPVTDELTIETPGGRSITVDVEREVSLADPNEPLSVEQVTDAVTINGDTSTRVYDGDTGEVTVTTAAGREWTVGLDALGRPLTVDGGEGLDPEQFSYDDRGLLTELAQGSRSWAYTHDEFGRVERVETAESQTIDYGYDDANRLVSTSLPSGAVYGFDYDATEDPTAVTMPSGATHDLDYTHTGDLSSYTPPDSPASFERIFDADQRRTRYTLPSGRSIDSSYEADRLTSKAYDEATVELGYDDDPANRQRRAVWSPASGGSDQEITLDYDSTVVTSMEYSGAASGSFSYDYDDDLVLTGLSLTAGGETVETPISYDADGTVVDIGPFTFARDGPNRLVSEISDGTLALGFDYDTNADVVGRTTHVGGTAVYDLAVTYDDAGRIVERTETVDGTTSVYGYTYDGDSRLVEVQRDGTVVESYSYDDNGNRTSRQLEGGLVETASYDSQDRLVEATLAEFDSTLGDVSYEFDEDGFLVSRGDDTFTYSARGELLEATVDGQTVAYSYDAFRRRVTRTDGDGTTEYLYGNPANAFQVTGVRDPDGVLTFLFYDDSGFLYALERGGDRYYVACDQVGSPRVVTDASGGIVREIGYDSFGNRTTDTNPGFQFGVGFAGGIPDPVTGLVRFGLRDYEPTVGRWTARDPTLFAGEQANLYVYVGNNPVRVRDPSGLAPDDGGQSGVRISAEFYDVVGGGASVTLTPSGGSVCAEAGVGVGAGVGVDPFAKPARSGLSGKASASASAGPAGAGVGMKVDPWTDSPKIQGSVGAGPANVSAGTDGVDFSVGGEPEDLNKDVRKTFSTSNTRVGAKAKAAVEACKRF